MQQLDSELEKNKNTTLVSFHESRLFSRVSLSSFECLCFTVSSTAFPSFKRVSVPSLEQRLKANEALCLNQRVCLHLIFFHTFSFHCWLETQDAFLSAFIPSPNNESPLAILQPFPHLVHEILELLTPSWVQDKRQKDIHERELSEQSRHTLSL